MMAKGQHTEVQTSLFDDAQSGGGSFAPPSDDTDRAGAVIEEPFPGPIATIEAPMDGKADTKPAQEQQHRAVQVSEETAVDVIEPSIAEPAGDPLHAPGTDEPGASNANGENPAVPTATIGEIRMVPLRSLSVASDNVWGRDVVRDRHFRWLQELAVDPGTIEPLLVVADGNGWAVMGDPAAYVALLDLPAVGETTLVPVREIEGSKAAILYHIGRTALATRPFRNMRRARLALTLYEVGLQGKAIARRLGLAGSGTSRDIKAARTERQYPALAALLVNPSDAPVSYYLDVCEHADQQTAPAKTMAALATAASRLGKNGKLAPTAAKAALGVPPKRAKEKAVEPGDRRDLGASAGAQSVAIERSADGGQLRLVMTFAAGPEPLDAQAERYETWLRTLASPFGEKDS